MFVYCSCFIASCLCELPSSCNDMLDLCVFMCILFPSGFMISREGGPPKVTVKISVNMQQAVKVI